MIRNLMGIGLALVIGVATFGSVRSSAAAASDGKMPITTSSKEALTAYHKGLEFLDTSQPESARPLLERAIELDPNFIMALDALRRVAPDFKTGRDIFNSMKDMIPSAKVSEGERIYLESILDAFNGDSEAQLAKFERLVEMFPNDERLLLNLGAYHYGRDDQKAVDIFERAVRVNPGFFPLYNMLGYSQRALGNNAGAEAAFKKAIELTPNSPAAYDSYAELLLKLGRFEESINAYDKALAFEPLYPSAQIGVAANLLQLGRHADARKRLSSLFDIAPHDGIRSGIHWALSVTYVDEGKTDKALDELAKNFALSKKNDDPAAMSLDLNNMGRVLLEAGRHEEALTKFKMMHKVSTEDPNQTPRGKEFSNAWYVFWEGQVLAAQGNYSAASANADEFERLAEPLQNPFFMQRLHELRGVIALGEKRYQDSLDELQKANASGAYNMYRMAMAYEGKGDRKKAREMYGYVHEYHSPLNFEYSFVRRKAARKLSS